MRVVHLRELSIVLLLGLLGCGKERVELLTDRAEAYNRSVRWSSVTAASAVIADDVRRSMAQRLAKQLSTTRVVDYSIVDLGVDAEKKNASVLVEFSFYNVADQDLKYRQELQIWKYDPKEQNWFLHEARDVPQQE